MSARRRRQGRAFMQKAEAIPQQDDFEQRIRALEALGTPPVVYHIKVFADWQNIRAGNGRFSFLVEEDMDGKTLEKVEMYVTTVSSSGIVQVQIARLDAPAYGSAFDILSTRIQCDAGEKHSSTASVAPVINPAQATVDEGDQIQIDVDAAGTNAKGLGVSLTFA